MPDRDLILNSFENRSAPNKSSPFLDEQKQVEDIQNILKDIDEKSEDSTHEIESTSSVCNADWSAYD